MPIAQVNPQAWSGRPDRDQPRHLLQDAADQPRWARLCPIFEDIVPLMRSRGFSQAEIDAILVGNPRRLLTFV
ncbi:hypothetical protein [Bosea lupini]|uniref:phosphotriesterase family protein n=1 Tax=Bosea lupini TaxID=1036779 RepID=UPI00244F005A|nr:hypothetical protein [Bosea lupini]